MKEIIHRQRRSGMTYEQELEILSEVYRLALESYRKRKQNPAARPSGRGENDGKAEGDSADESIIRR